MYVKAKRLNKSYKQKSKKKKKLVLTNRTKKIVKGKKYTSYYKKGFREGFNNPKTNKEQINIFLKKNKKFSSEKGKQYFEGLVSGVAVREQERSKGKNEFIRSDKDLEQKIS